MNDDCLKLTVYFGESDRVGDRLLSDALIDLFERHELHAAVLMRAVEGFGIKHELRTDRFLTLSEDLPLVAVAVDERQRIEAVLPAGDRAVGGGSITLERARLLHDGLDVVELPEELHEATKLTIYLGRDERVDGRPAFVAVVELPPPRGPRRRHRAARRRRDGAPPPAARALLLPQRGGAGDGRSASAPATRSREALPGLDAMLERPDRDARARPRLQARRPSCRRAGAPSRAGRRGPRHLAEADGLRGRAVAARRASALHPADPAPTRGGASGATSLRGIWGFSGDHPPHGDRLFSCAATCRW